MTSVLVGWLGLGIKKTMFWIKIPGPVATNMAGIVLLS